MSDDLDQITDELPAALAEYAEEETPEITDTETPAEPTDTEAKLDPIAEKASKSGWTDRAAWEAAGKDPDMWVDAGEFIRRGALYEEIKASRREAKDLAKKLEAVAKYAAKAEQVGRDKALKELEAERMQAVEIGDVDAFKAADEQIKELQKAESAPQIADEPEVPEPVQNFAKRNQRWFEKDAEMTQFAIDRTAFHRNAGVPFEESLAKAEADVKRFYPEKFVNPNKEKPSPVAPNNAERRPERTGWNNLTSEQRGVFNSMRGVMTLDEFIAGLKAQGELK